MVMKSVFNSLKKAYYRIFYFIFKFESFGSWLKQSDKESAIFSVLTMTVLLYGDYMIFDFVVFELVFHYKFPTNMLYMIAIAIFVFNYMVFVRNEKYIEIKAMFADEPRKVKRRRRFWCWVYVIVSLFGFPIVGLFSEVLKAMGIIG